MRIICWYGASFLVISALLSHGQTAAPQKPPDSTSNQPTVKAAESAPQTTPASTVPKDSSAENHRFPLKFGGVTFGAGYGYGMCYPYYAYEPYGLYPYYNAPFVWSPYWRGYSLNDPSSDKGQIRLTTAPLSTAPKTAQVFLDGAYAGTADQLKSMWLAPGAYTLSVSTQSGESFHQRVNVLTGKSLKITATLVAPSSGEAKP
jgi:hypothetical protein